MSDSVKIFDTDGVPRGVRFGPDNSIITEDLYDYYIHTGQVWYSAGFDRRTGADALKTFAILLPVMEDASDFDIHIHWILSADAEFEITMGHNPSFTSYGTKMPVGNRSGRYILNPRYAVLYEDSVFSSIGTAVVMEDIIGSGKSNEAGHQSLGEFILPGGNNYGVEIKKVTSGSGWISWQWSWIEEYEGIVHAITTTTTTTTTS